MIQNVIIGASVHCSLRNVVLVSPIKHGSLGKRSLIIFYNRCCGLYQWRESFVYLSSFELRRSFPEGGMRSSKFYFFNGIIMRVLHNIHTVMPHRKNFCIIYRIKVNVITRPFCFLKKSRVKWVHVFKIYMGQLRNPIVTTSVLCSICAHWVS